MFCLFCLPFQRPDLPFQFVVQVLNTGQVFLGGGQLALGLLLAVAEFGDTGGFLKDLAPVFTLKGQNLVNTPLPNDRVAVAPQTGIHEQFMDIAQAAVLFVEEILAFARAVVPPGNHNLGKLRPEHAFCVI